MTGKSGRSRARSSGSGGSSVAIDCSTLSDTTSIASPDPAELAKLGIGTLLDVELQAGPQAVVAKLGRSVVGSLVPVQLVSLIACLKKGYRFNATVVRLDGGYCEVHIRCAGKA